MPYQHLVFFGLGFLSSVAFAQVPQLDIDHPDDPQNMTALFMVSLYNQKLAGPGTGLCVDFSTKDGTVNIGLDDSVFKPGQSTLIDQDAYNKKIRGLLDALAQTQTSGKIKVTGTAFTDGIPMRSQTNQQLADARCSTTLGALKGDENVAAGTCSGVTSPELERLPRGKQDCFARRKVVVTAELTENKVQLGANGKVHYTPDSFNANLGIAASSFANRAIESLIDMPEVPGTNGKSLYEKQVDQWKKSKLSENEIEAKSAEYLYRKLQEGDHPAISKKCDQFPLKQLTLSYIASQVSGLAFNYDHGVATGQMKYDRSTKTYSVVDPDTHQSLKLEPINAGQTPSILFACFSTASDPTKWDNSLNAFNAATENPTTNPGVFVSGNKVLADAKAKNPEVDAKSAFNIGFEPSLMKPEEVPNNASVSNDIKSSFVGRNIRGFFCKECGHGFYFEESKDANGKPVYTPVYDDRVVKETGIKGNDPLTKALNNLTADDPSVLGASLKPMMYVVNSCKDCKCNPMDKIRSKSASVTTIDPLAMGSGGPKSDFDSSTANITDQCVVRPPVWHTCGAAPNKVPPSEGQKFAPFFSYKNPFCKPGKGNQISSGCTATFGDPDFEKLVQQVGASCDPLVELSPQQKVNAVSCSQSPATRLPSQEVAVDCPASFSARNPAKSGK